MYEHRSHQPISHRAFVSRLARHATFATALVAGSLWLGMIGFHVLEQLSWLDAFLSSAMLLGGMGPVNIPVTTGGKLFAGFYALYAGLMFLVVAAVMLSPVVHRIMHRFHWDER